MNALRSSLSEMRDPTGPLFDGAMILVSGVLLLTPGFFTDTMGLLLLVPQVRAMLYHRIRARVEVRGFGAGMGGGQSARPRGPESDVLEGEYHRIDPDEPPSRH